MLLDRAFQLMQQGGTPALPVLNRFGELVGLFTPENVGEFMMIQSAIGEGPRPTGVRPPPLPTRPL
jgi:hypothetical protein